MKRRTRTFLAAIIVIIAVMSLVVAPALAAPATPMDGTEVIPADMPDPTDLSGLAIPAGFAIVGIAAYALAEILKRATNINKARLPVILAGFGIGMGILVVIFNPIQRIPIDATWQDIGWSIILGIFYGAMSGLTAVGVNQVIQQGAKLKTTPTAVETTSET